MEKMNLAETILKSYSMVHYKIEFIRHNENMTFKVTDEDSKNYLLRIHIPITPGMSGIQHTFEGLKSEMILLKELKKSGLLVQIPVMNLFGEYVTPFLNEANTTCYSTVLKWIDGDILTLEHENIDQLAHELGIYVGNLHLFSKQYKTSSQLTRPVYGIEHLEQAVQNLKFGVEHNIFTSDQYSKITATVKEIKKQVSHLNKNDDTFGFIHADYQLGNIIVNENQVNLIDFSLSGYGYFLFDLASAGTLFPKNLRLNFLKGYDSIIKFNFDDIKYIEGFILNDIFISYAMFIKGLKNSWIKDHFNRITENMCNQYLNNLSFFLA